MNGVIAPKLQRPEPPAAAANAAAGAAVPLASRVPRRRWDALRTSLADFWLDLLFAKVRRSPKVMRRLKPALVRGAYRCSRTIRVATAANARRIFGPDVSHARVRAYGHGVVGSFYDFVCDVGRGVGQSRAELSTQIECIIGDEHYRAARALRRGAIIATAHMGSFEAGAAALLDREPVMHVVFKRDSTRFESVRASLRETLGVLEAPVDDGLIGWMRLRDALARDEVVMVQADRCMPGQKGVKIPFLHGRLMLPSGPAKLALASGGAPIVPVFAIRTPAGRIRIHVEPAIVVVGGDVNAALAQFAAVLERYVLAYPDQWLLFHKAFCEDTDA